MEGLEKFLNLLAIERCLFIFGVLSSLCVCGTGWMGGWMNR